MAISAAKLSSTSTHYGLGATQSSLHRKPAAADMSYDRSEPIHSGSGMSSPLVAESYWSLPRSFSNPDASQMHHGGDSLPGSGVEKKRNKLGYHRTSVACSHCRRRKIRCIPSPGDAEGRCGNCIRLKKECNFVPTEQQQAIETRPRVQPPAAVESRNPSSPTSPGPNGSDMESLPQQFAPLGGSSSQMTSPTSSHGPSGLPILPSMATANQSYNFSQQAPSWAPPTMSPFLETNIPSWNNPWRSRSGMDSAGSKDPGPEPPLSATWASGGMDSGPRVLTWGSISAQGRSMSYSAGESLSGNHPPHYPALTQNMSMGRQGAPLPFMPPMPVTGMGEAYTQGVNSSDGSIPPMAVANPLQMQWQRHHSVQAGTQDPYGSWPQQAEGSHMQVGSPAGGGGGGCLPSPDANPPTVSDA